ncbi:MAG: hypothetical protein K0R36_1942 [Chryseobacterium sp.]|jgi:hypothetical protein|nr:hypothetical protein [Chryseobacterium sp.]
MRGGDINTMLIDSTRKCIYLNWLWTKSTDSNNLKCFYGLHRFVGNP